MTEIARLSSKGQLVIPKKIRDKMKWQTGDHIIIEPGDEHIMIRRATLETILEEADREWDEGKTIKIFPKERN